MAHWRGDGLRNKARRQMLQVPTEHQQSKAVLAGGALAGLLEDTGSGWLGALQGRLTVL